MPQLDFNFLTKKTCYCKVFNKFSSRTEPAVTRTPNVSFLLRFPTAETW